MRYRLLALFPIVWAAVLVAVVAVAPPAEAVPLPMRIEIEGVKLLALVGSAAAANAFERGDYLRRAWNLAAICYLLLLIRDLTYFAVAPTATLLGVSVQAWQALLVLAANGCGIAGTWLLARAWQIAGIELPGTPAQRRMIVAAAAVVAVAIVGNALSFDLRRLAHGQLPALVGVASDLGDIFSLCLIAPVLLTALALRGGLLKWPWGLLTASLACWLFYDATSALATALGAESSCVGRLASEAFRALACTFQFSAGLAQRFVVASAPEDAE